MRPALGTALLGLGLIGAAAAFDAEPVYVPGLVLVLVAAGAAGWVAVGSRGLSVTRTVAAATVLEEEVVAIDLVVRCSAVALPAGMIDDPLLGAPAPLAAGRRQTAIRINARFARRGRKHLAAPRILVRDPFGLATRIVATATAAELLVLPRLEPVTSANPAAGGDALGLVRGRPIVAAEVELDGVRPHRPGAPASRIFWAGFARTGELLERRMQPDGDTRPLVVLDPRGALAEADLDAAVRACASLCVHLARSGGCALLLPGDRRAVTLEPTLAAWPRAHVRLALVDGTLAPVLAGLTQRRGPVLYVAARAGSRSPRALAQATGAGRVLVVPGTLPGRPPSFSVAGCTGYALLDSRSRAQVA